jgi:hypothetical protein
VQKAEGEKEGRKRNGVLKAEGEGIGVQLKRRERRNQCVDNGGLEGTSV